MEIGGNDPTFRNLGISRMQLTALLSGNLDRISQYLPDTKLGGVVDQENMEKRKIFHSFSNI
jgi:hypothetical protein